MGTIGRLYLDRIVLVTLNDEALRALAPGPVCLAHNPHPDISRTRSPNRHEPHESELIVDLWAPQRVSLTTMRRGGSCWPVDNTSPQDGLALFSEFLACLGVGSELVGTFSLGLGGFGWMRGEGDRKAQLGPNSKASEVGRMGVVGDGDAGDPGDDGAPDGRLSVCLSSEVE